MRSRRSLRLSRFYHREVECHRAEYGGIRKHRRPTGGVGLAKTIDYCCPESIAKLSGKQDKCTLRGSTLYMKDMNVLS
jgi:hypothetical protein